MRAITLIQLRAAALLTVVGVLAGVLGAVRFGSIFIAIGTAIVALAQWPRSSGRRRIIECYFPLALAGVLFAVAVALPKGL
jgi:hypothetical protein